ncbi:hypothetical protein [Spirosoma luteum]|uniref:hypothetical protein n=1 Tax=Spirosoma luteum TaxID=431553 RepID=UPI0012FCE4EF|nr:hypothetical protein [Spirosoma luteum]
MLPSVHFFLLNTFSLIGYSYSETDNISNPTIYYYSIFNLIILSSLFFLKPNKDSLALNINFISFDRIKKYLSIYAICIIIMLMFFLYEVDLDLLYVNGSYLTMVDSVKMGITSSIGIMFHKTIPVNGIVCAFAFGFLFSTKRFKYLQLVLFVLFFILYIFELGANSRSAALIIFSLLMSIFIFYSRNFKKKIIIASLLSASILSYFLVLSGRGSYKQGVSQIAYNYSGMSKERLFSTEELIDNVLGGVSTFAQAVDLKGEYPEEYKILSFSPLPSSIDGFDELLKYQNRISLYVPFNAYSEVYHFGLSYLFLFYFLVFLCLRTANIAVLENRTVGLFLSLPMYLFFIANQQYPLRNNFRFLLIAGFLCFFYINFWKRRKVKNTYKSHKYIDAIY